MIYDRIENLSRYIGIHKNLDKAIRFLLETDLNTLPSGRTDIDGDAVYVNIMYAEARPASDLRYERHEHHLDIQLDLSGTEAILTGDGGRSLVTESSNPDTDFAFVSCDSLASCTIGPGRFIICMAGEPHMPGVQVTSDTALKKCVVKISV